MATTVARASSRLPVLIIGLLTAWLITAQPAQAASGADCDGAVCEEVTYSGGTVTSWKATVYPGSGYHCRTARFWINGGLVSTKSACGTGNLVAYANTPYYLSAGNQLCASWSDEPGYACVTI